MTIALTPFEGLCGFRPLAEIVHFIRTVDPLRELIGSAAAEEFETAVKGSEESEDPSAVEKNRAALRKVFTRLMESSPEAVPAAADNLVASARNSPSTFATSESASSTTPNDPSELASVTIRLNEQFPNDIGLFVFFFLNFIKLSPGEAMFLRADDIHAYISGDIMECMASSDNVVRAGFTPKFKDVSTLTSMLTYNYAPIEQQKMEPTDYPYAVLNLTAFKSNSSAMLYDPPIEEFSVVKTDLNSRGSKVTFEPICGPSVIICTGGKGTIRVGNKTRNIHEGHVFFVGAFAECIMESTGDQDEAFTTFKAFCELSPEDSGRINGNL